MRTKIYIANIFHYTFMKKDEIQNLNSISWVRMRMFYTVKYGLFLLLISGYYSAKLDDTSMYFVMSTTVQ